MSSAGKSNVVFIFPTFQLSIFLSSGVWKLLRLLSLTDSVKDRLVGLIHWKSRANFEQALLICKLQKGRVDLDAVRAWCRLEGGGATKRTVMTQRNCLPCHSCWFLPKWNPHPCGYYGDFKRECRCYPRQIENYRQRISGPLLDRIDLHVEVPIVEFRELSSTHQGESSATIHELVIAARNIQAARFQGKPATTPHPGGPRRLRSHPPRRHPRSHTVPEFLGRLHGQASTNFSPSSPILKSASYCCSRVCR